jgi:response regulator NasT
MLATLDLLLKNAGYETAQATSGDAALELAAQFHPDLALLDVTMSGMSGLDLAKKLQQIGGVPFMFVSANADTEIVKRATEFGALGYLLKPFDMAQVVPAFEAALSRADEIRHLRDREANLTTALNASRETAMAVGLLMAKYGANRQAAFDVLRSFARSSQKKIHDVAESLLEAEELQSQFKNLFGRNKKN